MQSMNAKLRKVPNAPPEKRHMVVFVYDGRFEEFELTPKEYARLLKEPGMERANACEQVLALLIQERNTLSRAIDALQGAKKATPKRRAAAA